MTSSKAKSGRRVNQKTSNWNLCPAVGTQFFALSSATSGTDAFISEVGISGTSPAQEIHEPNWYNSFMLYVQLLGQTRLLLDGQAIQLPRRKSRALVFYLAAHTKPLTREHLLAIFWPESDRQSGLQTFRVALHNLRKVLGNSLVVDKETLSLSADTKMDARLLEDRLSPPASDVDLLTSALELYNGDFLDGFSLPDSPEFDNWVTVQRERYRRLAMRGFSLLAELHEKRMSFDCALESLNRALTLDPLQEDLQRAHMRLLYLAGDRAGAIRHYEGFRRLLDKEMGVLPMAGTRALHDAILNDSLPPITERDQIAGSPEQRRGPISPIRPPDKMALPFRGRDRQLQVLHAWAATETRKLMLVEGEPGIGKTRLAEEFLRELDAIPIAGAAHELERTLPYQPIIEALRGLLGRPDWATLELGIRSDLSPVWRAECARLLPELAEPQSSPQRSSRNADESRLWEGINQFLLAMAHQRPIIIFLDDLHWAEASTLGMLGYLIRQSATAPILFLALTRSFAPRSPLAALVQTLIREDRLVRLTLSRLEAGDVASISNYLSPTFSFPLSNWLMQTSEGNPFILSELVRHARDNGVLLPNGVVNLDALSSSPVVPQTVYSLTQSRLQRLSDTARRVLDAAVAVGREFEFELVARVAALSENLTLDALDELNSAGLIHPVDTFRYAFDHSLTPEVAYREISEARHRLIHRRVAEAMESIYHDRLESVAGTLAWHFAEGNSPERAAPYAYLAGQQAFRLAAWPEAIASFEQALSGSAPIQRMPILMALGDAHLHAGNAIQASEAFREVLNISDSRGDNIARDAAMLSLARSFLLQARFSEAIALARQVREIGRPQDAVQAEFLWGTALSLEGADLSESAAHLQMAETICVERTPMDIANLAQIEFELGSIAAQQGDLAQAIVFYRQSLETANQAEDPDSVLTYVVLAHNNLAYHLHLLDDPSATDHALAGLHLARDKGLLGLQTYLLSTLGEIALAKGDLEAAERHMVEGLAIAERLSIPERVAGLNANLGLVSLDRNQISLGINKLSTALAQADALGTRHLSAQIRLWLAPHLPPTEARAYIAEARSIAQRGGRQRLLEEAARVEARIPHI